MRAVMVMFDSLNRRFLEPYGCDFTKTPNFRRLAEQMCIRDSQKARSLTGLFSLIAHFQKRAVSYSC